MAEFDKEWFVRKLEENNKTLRGLARHMELDPSAVSRMLDGKRRMKMDEANSVASFLSVTVDEVLSHAGVNLGSKPHPVRIMIVATIDQRGNVTTIANPSPLPQAVLDKAGIALSVVDGPLVAAQVRAASGPLAVIDDAVMLYRRGDGVDPAAIGTLAICRNGNNGQIVGRLERARKTGEAQIMTIDGKSQSFDLQSAAPIVAIIP